MSKLIAQSETLIHSRLSFLGQRAAGNKILNLDGTSALSLLALRNLSYQPSARWPLGLQIRAILDAEFERGAVSGLMKEIRLRKVPIDLKMAEEHVYS
jgi:hypothetical protein